MLAALALPTACIHVYACRDRSQHVVLRSQLELAERMDSLLVCGDRLLDSHVGVGRDGVIRIAIVVQPRDRFSPKRGNGSYQPSPPTPPRQRAAMLDDLFEAAASEEVHSLLALPGGRLHATLHGQYTFADTTFTRCGMVLLVAEDTPESSQLMRSLQRSLHFLTLAFVLPARAASGAKPTRASQADDIAEVLAYLAKEHAALFVRGLVGHGESTEACLVTCPLHYRYTTATDEGTMHVSPTCPLYYRYTTVTGESAMHASLRARHITVTLPLQVRAPMRASPT